MPKVLVVDDSISVRKVVERALAGRQVEVVCAASGVEALDCMERDAPDVIVCDVVMPDRDGYEICDFVKKHPRLGDIPVILMSGIVNDEVRQRAARARSEGVLAKPFAAEDLLKRLDRYLGPLPVKEAEPAATVSMPVSPISVPAVPDLSPPEPVVKPEPVIRAEPVIKAPATTTIKPSLAVKADPPARPERLIPEPMVKPERPLDVPPTPEPVLTPPPPPAFDTSEPAPAPDRSARVEPALGASTPPVPATPIDGAAATLKQFTAMDGVQWAVLADREGFVVDATTNAGIDSDVAAALSACLAESSDGLGRELGRGALHGIILEYEKGIVVVYGVGPTGLLAVGLAESSVLGKVRYFARKALPELARAL
jgi:CheY-like chemotaxis protein/predicted regulator of Ras-like GTPase activity (Roadblock/LC7/MglB family)